MPAVSSNKASLIAKLLYPNEVQLIKIPMLNFESSGELGSKSFCFTFMKHQQSKTVNWNTLQREILFYISQSESTENY